MATDRLKEKAARMQKYVDAHKQQALTNEAMGRAAAAKNMLGARPGTGTPRPIQRRVQVPAGGFSPDYQKSKYAQRDAGLTGGGSAPVFSAPGFKGKAKKARIHSQRVQYERERRGAADRLNEIGARGQNQRAITGMQQRGQTQRQEAGFVQALQEQQNRFSQQNRQQQARFGQRNQEQQARFGQQSQMQQARFGQESMLDQLKAEREARKQALDYRAAGGNEAGAAAIGNQGFGMDYGAVNPVETAPKTGTYRFFQDDMDKWYSGHTGTGVTTPLNIGQLLNK